MVYASIKIKTSNFAGSLTLLRLFIRIMRNFSKIHLLTILVFGILSFKTLAHDQPGAYEIINLADDFYSVYQSSKKLSPEKRAERFSQYFTTQFEPFYSNKNFVKSIESFSEIEKVYLLKSNQLSKDLNGSMKSFIATFADFKSETPIYILHSLGRFNGATRDLKGKSYLMFGVDLMAKYRARSRTLP